jgi:RNA polymerase sigma-70 factor (ECF subfamily)
MIAASYDRIASTAFSLAVRVATDPLAAEEAVATAFATWDDRPAAFDESDGASIHALLTVRRQAFTQRQEDRRRRGHSLLRDPLSTDLPGPASGNIAARLNGPQQERLRLTLDALPPQTREAIELMFFEGLTEAELASRLGASPAVVREQIYAGLVTLRDATVTTP